MILRLMTVDEHLETVIVSLRRIGYLGFVRDLWIGDER